MSDAAVKAKTGRDWTAWFTELDAAKAAKLDHKGIVAVLSGRYDVPGWWRQMVAVEYERARGLRVRHQTSSGFSVAISKTLAADVSALFAASADASARKHWFPKGSFEPSSQTKGKYLRGSWNKHTRLEIGLNVKGPNKAQIAVQVSKLDSKSDVEQQRKVWKRALSALQTFLEA
jgi:hypothetical protein